MQPVSKLQKKARIEPGDTALVVGCGTIGIMVAIAALAGGCSKVFISDVKQEKLDIAGSYVNIIPINVKKENLIDFIMKETNGKGCDRVFEASGSPAVYPDFFKCTKRGGKVVLVGMMNGLVQMNVPWIQVHGLSIETLFRYILLKGNRSVLFAQKRI